MLSPGQKAPAFKLPDAKGGPVSLGQFAGRPVVLYFYPKDDTPGCTTEACGFRDAYTNFEKAGAVVIGVSPDAPARHEKFITKHDLPFILLSDTDHAVCGKYGVWVEKKMYGRTYWGVARTTFIISGEGRIVRIFEKVKPRDHAAEVLAALKG